MKVGMATLAIGGKRFGHSHRPMLNLIVALITLHFPLGYMSRMKQGDILEFLDLVFISMANKTTLPSDPAISPSHKKMAVSAGYSLR